MRRHDKLPELLAPAGNFDALVAAVRAGADAVYIGGKSFGARAYAKNFDMAELERAVRYCHLHGVKLYLTLNTLIYDKETEEFSNFVRGIRRISPDALIMADLGAMRIVRRIAPELEIHASTQAGVHNTEGANEAYRLGCKRVVLAREISYDNIKAVTEASLPETEVFLHGALCVCHSGQCLFSSLVGGRSGNRGECAQPCRLPYNGKYPLSLRDLSLAEHINELIDSGVSSLKIEGRMKSADYVYTVTSIYRRLLDECRRASTDECAALSRAFSRGGFTDGYFTGNVFDKMTGIRSSDDKRETRESLKLDFSPDKLKISAKAEFSLGVPARLTLKLGERSVSVCGEIPERAERAPLTEAGLKERLSKMGNTYFLLSESDIEIQLQGNINLSPAAINSLRRAAASALEGEAFSREDIISEKVPAAIREKKLNTALFFRPEELSALGSAIDFFDIIFTPLMSSADFTHVNGVYLPPVIMQDEWESVKKTLCAVKARGVKYALVGNISHIALVRDAGLTPIGDFRLNISNSYARDEYRRLGIKTAILSPEISLPMARDIGGGEIVYGRIPLMLTERCFTKENFGCNKCGNGAFVDRTGAEFPIIREWSHRSLILNSTPTYMGDRQNELDTFGIGARHFIFTKESADEIKNIVEKYKRGEPLSSFRRIGRREDKSNIVRRSGKGKVFHKSNKSFTAKNR